MRTIILLIRDWICNALNFCYVLYIMLKQNTKCEGCDLISLKYVMVLFVNFIFNPSPQAWLHQQRWKVFHAQLSLQMFIRIVQ